MDDIKHENKKTELPGNEPAVVIKKTYPKWRWYCPDNDKFYFSGQTLFVTQKDGSQIIAPFPIIVADLPRPLNVEDLQNLSEFTGILDSTPDMMPIYSGDKVRIPDAQGFDGDLEMVVSWVPQFARWNISPYLFGRRAVIVTGNIYQPDNPANKSIEAKSDKFEVAGSLNAIDKTKKKLPN